MKVSLIRIGASQGLRLPQAFIDQCGLGTEAELTVVDGKIVLSALRPARAGWAAAFATDPAPPLSAEEADWLNAHMVASDPNAPL